MDIWCRGIKLIENLMMSGMKINNAWCELILKTKELDNKEKNE